MSIIGREAILTTDREKNTEKERKEAKQRHRRGNNYKIRPRSRNR